MASLSRNILIVAPISPPSTLSAAHRIGGMTKYLGELGHSVTVLTSTLSGTGPIPGAVRTIRTRDLMSSRLNWRRRNFEALAKPGLGPYNAQPSILASLIVPDVELVGWFPFALAAAVKLREQVDCVITSSPPNSGHLVGLALRALGIPWVADFRDGWTFESCRPPYSHELQRSIDCKLEQTIVKHADALVAVTAPITADLCARFDKQAVTITNGFDPTELIARDSKWTAPLNPNRHSLVYTGSLSYGGNSITPLLNALDLISQGNSSIVDNLEIVFAGPITEPEIHALSKYSKIIRVIGRLSREQTLELQRAADSLLLIAGDHRPSVATGKLYEYLATGHPILVLGSRSAAARIVEDAGAGFSASAHAPASITKALLKLIEGRDFHPKQDVSKIRQKYGYPELAGQMAAQIELAIAGKRY